MMKLFGFKQAQPDLHAPELEKRYTRFPHNHSRAPLTVPKAPPLQPCETTKVLPRRPSARKIEPVAETTVEQASLADQLHSEARISTSLLRRALPLRFADIDARTHEFAREETADLMAQFR